MPRTVSSLSPPPACVDTQRERLRGAARIALLRACAGSGRHLTGRLQADRLIGGWEVGGLGGGGKGGSQGPPSRHTSPGTHPTHTRCRQAPAQGQGRGQPKRMPTRGNQGARGGGLRVCRGGRYCFRELGPPTRGYPPFARCLGNARAAPPRGSQGASMRGAQCVLCQLRPQRSPGAAPPTLQLVARGRWGPRGVAPPPSPLEPSGAA